MIVASGVQIKRAIMSREEKDKADETCKLFSMMRKDADQANSKS